MKPLVYWCRWHDARLRLRGRDDSAVWGELAFPEETKIFHFDLKQWVLSIGKEPNVRAIQLDEMGVEIQSP